MCDPVAVGSYQHMAVKTAETPRRAPATHTEKGLSLARGPALILGTILLAAGLYFLYKQHRFLPFSNFPNGSAPVDGKVLFGIFGANGWTGMLTAVGGGLLLFGAAQHLLAKTMSLIVGAALGAAAVIAVISGNVLGMAAANSWTKLGWAIAAAILLLNTLVPRRRREVVVPADEGAYVPAEDRAYEPVGREERYERTGVREPAVASEDRTAVQEPVAASEDRMAVREPVAASEDRMAVQEPVAASEDRTAVQEPVAASEDRTAVNRPAAQDAAGQPTANGDEPLVRPLSDEERARR